MAWEAVNLRLVQAYGAHQLSNTLVLVALVTKRVQRLLDDLFDRHARVQRAHRILEHHLQVAAGLLTRRVVEFRGILTAQHNAAAGSGIQVHDLQQGGGLAGAGLAHDSHALTGAKVEGDVLDRMHSAHAALHQRTLGQRELLVQVLHFQGHLALLARNVRQRVLRKHRGGVEGAAVDHAVFDLVVADAGNLVTCNITHGLKQRLPV